MKELWRPVSGGTTIGGAVPDAGGEPDYFIEKKLFPNIDFYSGIALKALGFPPSMFTVLFALGRTAGWIAQWKEMIADPEQRIGRPRQLYIGEKMREYVPMELRP